MAELTWAQKNPERVRAIHRRYRQKHWDQILEWQIGYRARLSLEQRERINARHRKYYRAHYSHLRALERQRSRFTEHGITKEDFDKMMRHQKASCAMCHAPFSNPRRCHVDHDHDSNIIRGLLCMSCNLLLGYAKDSTVILKEAIDYVNNPPFQIPSIRNVGRIKLAKKRNIMLFMSNVF